MIPPQAILYFVICGFLIGFLLSDLRGKPKRENRNNYVLAKDRKYLPDLPGVYFIIDSKDFSKVHYVGSAKSIRTRFQSHSTLKEIAIDLGINSLAITWITCKESELQDLEQSMINKFVSQGMAKYNRLMTVTR